MHKAGSRIIIVVVQVRAVKIHVAAMNFLYYISVWNAKTQHLMHKVGSRIIIVVVQVRGVNIHVASSIGDEKGKTW